jgi:ankyrin repeat protein
MNDVNECRKGLLALHYAIANSNLSNVQFLAEQWPAPLLSEDPEGQSVLHIAVAQKGASFRSFSRLTVVVA